MDAKAKMTTENKLSKNSHCWTVPTEWPHEFDTEATVQGDYEAGNWFMRNWRPPKLELADAARRAITATAYRKWAKENMRDTLPDEAAAHDLKYNDYDELLANYEKDMRGANERAERRKGQPIPTQQEQAA